MGTILQNLNGILAFAPQPTQPGQESPPIWTTMFPILLMVVIFYFILFRPQQKRSREHAALLKTIRTGDKIVTSGGVVGTVITVKEKTLSLRSADTKLEVLKSAVSEITERGAESSEA